ncbi:MAG: hypothetical protein C3F15_13000, partial [Holophagae bacterium]
EIRHPDGSTERFAYDAAGNTTRTVERAGAETRSIYDAASRLTSFTDAAGRATSYGYDGDGRLSEKRLADGTVIRYAYSADGDLIEATDGVFPVRYGYDAGHRRTLVEYPSIKRSLRYEHGGAGQLAAFTDSEGRRFTYDYDPHGRLAAIRLPDGEAFSFSYDARNRMTGIRYPNGVTGAWAYDARGLPTSIIYTGTTGAVLAGGSYAYDSAGNLTEAFDSRWRATSYRHDAAGRLVEETGPYGATSYTYLAGGNRGSRADGSGSIEYRYETADRLAQAGSETFRHDAAGNLVERRGPKGVTRYEYDAENRLVKVIQPDGTETSFGYAPTGERIWRRTSEGLTYLVSDGVNLLAELDQDLTPLRAFLHAPGIDRPLVMFEGGQPHFYHPTVLGSIAVITDRQGEISATYETDAFGSLRAQTGSVANPFVFTARELEPGLGLYYYRARYYDPALGRFLTEDPYPPSVFMPADMNPYVYARNAPTRYTDPLGLQGRASFARTFAETALSQTGATYDVYRVSSAGWDAGSEIGKLGRSVARAAASPTAQVAATRLTAETTARAAGHAVGMAASAAALGPAGPGTYVAVAGNDLADVARSAVAEIVRPTPGPPVAGSPSAAPLPGAASTTGGLSPGDTALLSALARLAPAPPQTGGLGMDVARLREAVGGPGGGARSGVSVSGGDAIVAMVAQAQAEAERVEAVLKRQLAEEAARNAQRRFSAVQAEQAEQAELRAREHELDRATLDVTGDLVQRAAAIRGEAEALKTAQDADIQAIRSAAASLEAADARYQKTNPSGVRTLCDSCLAVRGQLEGIATAVPQARQEAEAAMLSTRTLVEEACREPKTDGASEGSDAAYAHARRVGELLNAVNAQARLVPDLEARFRACAAEVDGLNQRISAALAALDEADGVAQRATADAAAARDRVGTPVAECGALLRRMDALTGGAAATAGDRANAVIGHRTFLVDVCSQLEANATTGAAEADAVATRAREIQVRIESQRLFGTDAECVIEPFPTEELTASTSQAAAALIGINAETGRNAGRVIKCLSPESAPVELPENSEGSEPKAPDNEGESVPALVVSSTFTTTPAEPPAAAPAGGAQPPALVRASKPGAAAPLPTPARPGADENPVTQVYSLADGSTVQGQYRVLAPGREGTVVASVGFRDGSRKILSGQSAFDACVGLGYYVRVPGIAGWARSGLAFAKDPRAPDIAAAPPPAEPQPSAPPPSDGGSILEGPANYLGCITVVDAQAEACHDACVEREGGRECGQACDERYQEGKQRCDALP